ncbi:MAG: RHS repeat-associated core domain-containing protein [Phycisphaerales bacterium]|nr:RHS repeat-associated core domain-containing protein [Phycisphaerales bacterium]
MVATTKNFRAKHKHHRRTSARFARRSVASAALRATRCRRPQPDNNFVAWSLGGENRNLDSVDQNGNTLKYDAWNRLISVTNSSGQVIAEYSYDARGYRVSETYPLGGAGLPVGTANYIYYTSNWQPIEVRTNGTANSNVTSQTVWSAAYINAAILQDTYLAGVIQPDSRIYFLHDANWNTTAVVTYNATTQTWAVAQRYVYSPYGSLTVLNADFSATPSGTQPVSDYLYQGMTLDAVTGLYYARNRNYSPSLGVWISQDPAGYINGADRYQFVESSPTSANDPFGLVNLGARRIMGDTFALRPALAKESPGVVQNLQQALRNLGLVTAIANLPEGAANFWELVSDYEDIAISAAARDPNAIMNITAEIDSSLARFLASKLFEQLQDQVKDQIKDLLNGFDGALAKTEGAAVWVRVTYQQYESENVLSFSFYPFYLHCKKPEWVAHHQWVKVPYAWPSSGGVSSYSIDQSKIIAYILPWAYGYANHLILSGGN